MLFCNLPLCVPKHIPFLFADLIYCRHTIVFVLLQALGYLLSNSWDSDIEMFSRRLCMIKKPVCTV